MRCRAAPIRRASPGWDIVGVRRHHAREFQRKTVPAVFASNRRHGLHEIRPVNLRHMATILPVGKEGEFIMKKNEMMLTFPEESDRKIRAYQVVGMTPAKTDTDQAR